MQKYLKTLEKTYLFNQCSAEDINNFIKYHKINIVKKHKDDIVLLSQNTVNAIGVLLEGQLSIIQENREGNTQLIEKIAAGDIFAEAFVCAELQYAPVTVIANVESAMILLDYPRLLSPINDPYYQQIQMKIIQNLLHNTARKLLTLKNKLEILQHKSIRNKISAFFAHYSRIQQNRAFTIPFNRQELADYLGINRSALSRALSDMQKEQLIEFKQNHFRLLKGIITE